MAGAAANDRWPGAGRNDAGSADHGRCIRRLCRRLDQAILARIRCFWSGAVAASVVTFFTFLPSFLFILIGGPLIETTHDDLKFTAPLTAITAAVVGVIVNLAVFFGYHVLWPAGFSGRFEAWAAVIGVAAAISLFRFKAGIIPVIFAAGLAGFLLFL